MIKFLYLVIIMFIFGNHQALAETDAAAELQRLQAQLKDLTAQVNRLEQRLQAEAEDKSKPNHNATNNQLAAKASNSQQPPRLRFSGDMRGRYDYEDLRDQPSRARSRIRLRLAADAQINDTSSLHMRLATGSDNPTSANVTLDGGFSRKDIGLDRAYIKHQISTSQQLLIGKMEHPYKRVGGSGILFDGDINPEGLAWQLAGRKWHTTIGGFYLDEQKNDDDIMLYAAQFGFQQSFTDSHLQLGVGYYHYDKLKGAQPLYNNSHYGNRTNSNNQLLNDFNITELYAQYDNNQLTRPLSIYSSYLKNSAADNENEAFLLGFKYGSTNQPGDWQLAYNYHYTEVDAVLALLSDSDFAGGYTDSRGHNYQFVYGLNQQMLLAVTWIDAVANMHLGSATDYDRLMLDVSYWFK